MAPKRVNLRNFRGKPKALARNRVTAGAKKSAMDVKRAEEKTGKGETE